jgi:hypothetical protein
MTTPREIVAAVRQYFESTNLPIEEDPATREWIAIPAAEATEEWGVRRRDGRVLAFSDRADAEAYAQSWRGGERTVVHRFVGPWEPLEGEQDHA